MRDLLHLFFSRGPRPFAVAVVALIVLQLAAVVGAVYVAVHFIVKFW